MTETYSLSSDFPSGLNSEQLSMEIDSDVTITTSLSYINIDGDVVDIVFVSTLSAPEKSALDSLISSYTFAAPPKASLSLNSASYGSSSVLNFIQTGNRVLTVPDATDTFVVESTTQTLQNKKLVTSNTEIVDASDNTKVVKFDTSTANSGTTLTFCGCQTGNRVITVPDDTTTLLGTSTSQDISNKNLHDNSVQFVDQGDTTKQLKVQLSGASASTNTTITSSQTANRVLTLPDDTTTLVGTTTTQTLTNKTVDTSNNTIRVTKSDVSDLSTASTTTTGLIEIATQSEVDTGTDTLRAVTPSTLTNWSGLGGVVVTELSSTTTTSTTSTSYVTMNSMTTTPSSGNYLVMFSASSSPSIRNKDFFHSIYVDGNMISHSERVIDVSKNNTVKLNIYTQAKVTVNGSQVVEIRYKAATSSTYTVYERSMVLIKTT